MTDLPPWQNPVYQHICRVCGSIRTVQTAGKGPHAAGLRCLDCGAFRWLKKNPPQWQR